jgi:hypothetical protein
MRLDSGSGCGTSVGRSRAGLAETLAVHVLVHHERDTVITFRGTLQEFVQIFFALQPGKVPNLKVRRFGLQTSGKPYRDVGLY